MAYTRQLLLISWTFMSYKLRLKLNYHMHKFLIPLSVENLYMSVSFFVLVNWKYFINLLVTLYTERAISIFKNLWISKKCSDLNERNLKQTSEKIYNLWILHLKKTPKIMLETLLCFGNSLLIEYRAIYLVHWACSRNLSKFLK